MTPSAPVSIARFLTLALAFLVSASAHAQTPEPGRLVGRVTDSQGNELPGVLVRLIEGDAQGTVVTDAAGRFAFNGLDVKRRYTARAELPGFTEALRGDLLVGPGETVTVDFSLSVGCRKIGYIDGIVLPLLDEFLTVDAVVHVRVAEEGRRRTVEDSIGPCVTIREATATVLGVARVSRQELQSGAVIPISSTEVTLRAGTEYLAFLIYSKVEQRFLVNRFFEVVADRVQANGETRDLGFRDGDRIGLTLKRLGEIYKRHSRYRTYDSVDATAMKPLEALRYKTGWLLLGAIDGVAWTDGQPFEVVADRPTTRTLPRPRDRIRLKTEQEIEILDFGSRGEARRKVSPTTRPRCCHVTAGTGTWVDPEHVYTVADVQFEPFDEGQRLVWVRVVAGR